MKSCWLAIAVFLIAVSGCASPTYRQVFREKSAGNFREFCASKDLLYAAVAKVLCEKNFIIENEDKEKGFILGKRSFQQGRKTLVLLIQGKILEDIPGRSSVYINAIETTETYYIADHTRFFMFFIPLPGGGGKDVSTVKQAEKTIQDKQFYNDFFAEIDSKARDIQVYQSGAVKQVVSATREPQAQSSDAGKQAAMVNALAPQPVNASEAGIVVANQTGTE